MSLTQLSTTSSTPFSELMHIDKLSDGTYRSTCCAYEPGGNVMREQGLSTRAYGGHVYAQSVWAAAQTVSQGFICHNVSGNFIQAGLATVPFIFKITTLMDGRNFCMRSVDAMQSPDVNKTTNSASASQSAATVMVCRCTVVFKRHSTLSADQGSSSSTPSSSSASSASNQSLNSKGMHVQPPKSFSKQYASVLNGARHPSEHPIPPSYDGPQFNKSSIKYTGPPFPGLHSHMVEMSSYNNSKAPLERRQLHLYSVVGSMPSISEAPNLHVAAHLYASDRNGLFTLTNMLEVQEDWGFMTTLTHHVIFHCAPEELSLNSGNTDEGKWFVHEMWADGYGDERLLYTSKIWTWDEGASGNRHVATAVQDGVMRLKFGSEEQKKRVERKLKRNGVL